MVFLEPVTLATFCHQCRCSLASGVAHSGVRCRRPCGSGINMATSVGDVIQEYEKLLDCRFPPQKVELIIIDRFGHKVNNSIVG